MATYRQQKVYPGQISIIEEPSSVGFRFRYKSETGSGRTAGSILGVKRNSDHKSFPKVQIQVLDRNLPERAHYLVVSCVTTEHPFLAHPNHLIGNGCVKGVLYMRLALPKRATTIIELKQIGILRIKRGEVSSSLQEREEAKIDPFKNGFYHKSNLPSTISLKALRLCFQVLYFPIQNNVKNPRSFCEPVVSDIIYSKDKNTVPDLAITRLSDCISYADGDGKDIIIWCGNVKKDDIEIKFFQEDEDGEILWEAKATNIEVQKKNSSIAFQAPVYRMSNIEDVVEVKLKLYRPSDASEGEAKDFLYLLASNLCTCKYYRNYCRSLENNCAEVIKGSPKMMNIDTKRARFESELSAMTKTLSTLIDSRFVHQITESTISPDMDWSGTCDLVEQNEFRSAIQFTEPNTLKGQSTNQYYQQPENQPTYPLNICSPLYEPPLNNQYPNIDQANASRIAENRATSISEDILFDSDELRKLADAITDVNPDNFPNFEFTGENDFQPTQPQVPQYPQFSFNNYCPEAYGEPGPSNYNITRNK